MQEYIKRIMYHNQTGFVQGLRGYLVFQNQGNGPYLKKVKEKKMHVVIMIISINVENHLTKFNTFFLF